MFNYKVEYIYAEPEKKKWYESGNKLDAWTLAKELEALLVEYDEKGFELITITPISVAQTMGGGSLAASQTDGLMVTFKKKT